MWNLSKNEFAINFIFKSGSFFRLSLCIPFYVIYLYIFSFSVDLLCKTKISVWLEAEVQFIHVVKHVLKFSNEFLCHQACINISPQPKISSSGKNLRIVLLLSVFCVFLSVPLWISKKRRQFSIFIQYLPYKFYFWYLNVCEGGNIFKSCLAFCFFVLFEFLSHFSTCYDYDFLLL